MQTAKFAVKVSDVRIVMEGPSLADSAAGLVLDTYDSLPKTGKPSVRSNGIVEWTIIAGLVAQREGPPESNHILKLDSTLHCLSLATGV